MCSIIVVCPMQSAGSAVSADCVTGHLTSFHFISINYNETGCRVGVYLQVAVLLIQSLCMAKHTIQDSATMHTYSRELVWPQCCVGLGDSLMKCSWKLLAYVTHFSCITWVHRLLGFNVCMNPLIVYYHCQFLFCQLVFGYQREMFQY